MENIQHGSLIIISFFCKTFFSKKIFILQTNAVNEKNNYRVRNTYISSGDFSIRFLRGLFKNISMLSLDIIKKW